LFTESNDLPLLEAMKMAIGNSSNQVVMAMLGKEVCNGGVACNLLKQGSLSFSIPLWFVIRHHFFVEKTML
jgi:hypothetical protein